MKDNAVKHDACMVAPTMQPSIMLSSMPRLKPLVAGIRNACLPAMMLSLAAGTVFAGPEGGQVSGGQGTISKPDGSTTNIHQQSHNMAIDWSTYNVKKNETVNYYQPSKNANSLNRIHDQNPSQIFGRINANGNVLLVNPNGVFFGPSASVNVNSLIASGHDLSVDDFMNGRHHFKAAPGQSGGPVINQGLLQAATGGSINLIGGSVSNEGLILASAGQVNLIAGDQITMDFDGDGLMRFRVDKEVVENAQSLDSAVKNTGEIIADGGTVLLSGRVAQNVFSHVVNNEGVIKAGRIENQGGKIVLAGAGGSQSSVINTGTLDASAIPSPSTGKGGDGGDSSSPSPSMGEGQDGGEILLTGDTIEQQGIIRADSTAGDGGTIKLVAEDTNIVSGDAIISATSSPDNSIPLEGDDQDGGENTAGKGGTVHVLGDKVALLDASMIDVSGELGGGEVLIGGDYQGKNPEIQNATATVMAPDATIKADAGANGDGGKVILWADETTKFHGTISARGGAESGDGGFVETSGKEYLTARGSVDASAPNGQAGEWLLDPRNISLQIIPDTAGDDSTGGTFNGLDPNLFESTADDAIADIDQIVASLEAGTSVTIQTGDTGLQLGNITVDDEISANVGGGGATLSLLADSSILINHSIISTGNALNLVLTADANGMVGFTNGADLITAGGDVTFNGGGVYVAGTLLNEVNSGGGNIDFNGQVVIANSAGFSVNSGGGNITFDGAVDSGNNYTHVTPGSIDWTSALAAAQSGAGDGVGDTYLATITSAFENAIAGAEANYEPSWLGGQRTDASGTWRWVTGPEGLEDGGLGRAFFDQDMAGSGGVSIDGAFTNWNAGEPNNSGGNESALQFTGTTGVWNDLPEAGNNLNGYVMETNATPSSLTVNAGAGTVTFSETVGANKALSTLDVTATTINMNGGGVTTTGAQTYTGAVNLGANNALDSSAGNGNITFTNTINGGFDLTLSAGIGNIDFQDAIGGGSRIGTLDIVSANNVNLDTVTAASVIQQAGDGTTILAGAVDTNTATGVNIVTDTITVNQSITTTTDGVVTLNADTGTLTLAAAGDINADGAVNLTGASGISTAADVTTTGDNVNFNSATTLTGNVVLSTGAGAGDIAFAGTLDGTTADTETLDLTAGTGNVDFQGLVGGTTSLAAVTVNNAQNVDIGAAFDAASFTQTAGTGTTTVDGALTATTGNIDITSDTITVNALLDTVTAAAGGTVTLNADTNALTLAAAGDINSDGAVSLTGAGGIGTSGDVTTTGDNVTFNSAATLTGDVALSTGIGAGNVIFQNTLDSDATARNLTLTSGTGDIQFNNDVGSTARLDHLLINSTDDLTLADGMTLTAQQLTQTAGTGDSVFGGTVTINTGNGVGAGDGTFSGGALNITTDGAIEFKALLSTTGLDGALSGGGAFSEGGDIVLDGGTTVTLNGVTTDGGSPSCGCSGRDAGSLTVTAGSEVILAGDISAQGGIHNGAGGSDGSGGTVTFNSAVTLAGNTAINTTRGGSHSGTETDGDIVFNSTLDADNAFTETLDLTAGTTGNIVFAGTVGATTALGDLTIVSTNNVAGDAGATADAAAITAASYTQNGGDGTTRLSTLTTRGANNTAGGNVSVNITGDFIASGLIDARGGSTTAGNAGQSGGIVSITADSVSVADINSSGSDGAAGIASQPGGAAGAVALTSLTGDVHLAGNLTAQGGDGDSILSLAADGGDGANITITGPVILDADIVVSSTGGAAGVVGTDGADGNITFNDTVDADAAANDRTLSLDAGDSTITLGDAVGGSEALNSLTLASDTNGGATGISLTSETVSLGAGINLFSNDQNIEIFTDNLDTGAGVTIDAGLGDFTIAPSTVGNTIEVCDSGDAACVGDPTFDSSYDIGGFTNITAASFTIGRATHTGDITIQQVSPLFDLSVTNGGTGSITMNGAYAGTGFDLVLTSGSGGITDGTAGAGGNAITVDSLALVSTGNIDVTSVTPQLAAVTTGGNIFIENTGAVNITDLTVATGLDASGTVSLINTVDITLGAAVTAGTTVNLEATGGSINDTQDDRVTDITGTAVTLTAQDEIGGNSPGGATTDTRGAIEISSSSLDVSVTTAGNVVLSDVGGTELTDIDTVSGTVDILSDDDLTVGDVDATGAVTIATTAGSINDAAADTVTDITGSSIDLDATTGIGNTAALELSSASISADTTNGDIDIANDLATAVAVSSLTTGTGNISFAQSGGGDVSFATVTTTDGAIDLSSDAGDLTVGTAVTAGGAGDISYTTTTSGDIVLTGTTTAADDAVMMNSVGSINGSGLVTVDTMDLDAVTGIGDTTALSLAASTISADTTGGDIDIANDLATAVAVTSLITDGSAITFNQTGDGGVTFTTVTTTGVNPITLNSEEGLAIDGALSTGGGLVTLNADTDADGGLFDLQAPGSITTGGGDLDITASDFDFTGSISLGGGALSLNFTLAGDLCLGDATGGCQITLDNTDLGTLTAATADLVLDNGTSAIRADSAGFSNVNLDLTGSTVNDEDADVGLTNIASLTMTTSAAIGAASGGGDGLTINADTVVVTETSGNAVTLTDTGAGGDTTYNIGTVNPVGALDITQTSNDILVGLIDASGSTVTVDAAAGSIQGTSDDGTADILGTTIDLTAGTGGIGTSTVLDVTASTALNADTTADNGNILIDSIGNLPLGLVDAGLGTVTLDSTAAISDADGAAGNDIRAGIATLTAATGIGGTGQSLAIEVIASTMNATTTTSDGIFLNSLGGTAAGTGAVDFASVQAQTAGNIELYAVTDTTLTDIDAADGTIDVQVTGADLTATDVVTGNNNAIDLTTATSGDITAGLVNAGTGTVTVDSAGAIDGATDDGVADITGGTINLVAGAGGIGTTTILDVTASTALNADTVTGDDSDIVIDSIGDLPVGLVDAGAGDVTLSSTGTIDGVADDGTADVAGATVNLLAAVGGIGTSTTLDVTATTALNADTVTGDDSDIVIDSIGDLPVGLVDAGTGNVTLDSTGNITDTNAAAVNTRGALVTLVAATDIGTSADPFDTDADNLDLTAGDEIYILENDGVTIDNATAAGDAQTTGAISIANNSGDITVAGNMRTASTLDVAAAGSITFNTVTLEADTSIDLRVDSGDAVTAALDLGDSTLDSAVINLTGSSTDADDTLIGQDVASTWDINGSDSGTLDNARIVTAASASFTDFANLTGGSDTDAFVFDDTVAWGGTIDGAAGADTLDWSDYSTAISVTLSSVAANGFAGTGAGTSFTNIDTITGASDGGTDFTLENSLTGANFDANWALPGSQDGTYSDAAATATLDWQDFYHLTGGNADDTFTLTALHTGDLTGDPAGAGNDGSDTFIFDDGANPAGTARLDGSINGGVFDGAGGGMATGIDTIDYSNSGLAQRVTIDGDGTDNGQRGTIRDPGAGTHLISGDFDNINSFVGNNLGTIFGPNADTWWLIDGVDQGRFGNARDNIVNSFNGFIIFGGNLNDTFIFDNGGQITDKIDGGLGINTLAGSTGADIFDIKGANEVDFELGGLVTILENIQHIDGTDATVDQVTFGDTGADVFNLDAAWAGELNGSGGNDTFNINADQTSANSILGETGDDQFVFADGFTVNAGIDGGTGINTLDFSALAAPVSVTLTGVSGDGFAGTNALIGGGFSNIGDLIGTAGTDTLTGLNAVSTWTVTGGLAGQYDSTNSLTFTDFENLTGGSVADGFNIAGSHAGVLGGGAGNDTFNLQAAGLVTTIAGGSGTDEIIASNNATTFNVTGNGSGDVNDGGVKNYSGVENLSGDSAADIFNVSASHTGILSGNDGDDVFNFTAGTLNGTAFGGAGDDDFFLIGSGRAGLIDGDGHAGGDTLDASAATGSVTLTLNGNFTEIENVIGNGGGSTLVGDITTASNWNLNAGNGGVLNTVDFSGFNTVRSGTGGANTFAANGAYNGTVNLTGTRNFWNYTAGNTLTNGNVTGTGSLTIGTPAAGVGGNMTIGGGDLVLPNLAALTGPLFIGGVVSPATTPLNNQDVTVNTNILTVSDIITTGGDIVLLGGQINLDAPTMNVGGQMNFVATGNSCNPGVCDDVTTGNGNVVVNQPMTVNADSGLIIAAGGIQNADNLTLDFGGGDLQLAVSQAQQETSQPNQLSNAQGIPLTSFSTNFINVLGLNVIETIVNFFNPALQLFALEDISFLDTGLFEEDLSLFGVIGEGIALALAQCEELDGCAPNITIAELDTLLQAIEARIEELESRLEIDARPAEREKLEKLLAGYRAELEEFRSYRQELQAFLTGPSEGDALGDDLGDEFVPGEDELPEGEAAPLTPSPAESIDTLAKMLESIEKRVEFLESLKTDTAARQQLGERTGIDLGEENLDRIIENTRKEAEFIESLLQKMIQDSQARRNHVFSADAGNPVAPLPSVGYNISDLTIHSGYLPMDARWF